MVQMDFKAAHKLARIFAHCGYQTRGQWAFRRDFHSDLTVACKSEADPKTFYWELLQRRTGSKADRKFYIKRARAIRERGFNTIHVDVKP